MYSIMLVIISEQFFLFYLSLLLYPFLKSHQYIFYEILKTNHPTIKIQKTQDDYSNFGIIGFRCNMDLLFYHKCYKFIL